MGTQKTGKPRRQYMLGCVLVLTIWALFGGCLTGCDVINSGPKMMQTVQEGMTAVGTTMLAKFNPDKILAETEGRINDPEFVVEGYFSTGVIYKMDMRLIGADASMSLSGTGSGGPLDEKTLAAIQEVWARPGLDQREREARVLKLVLDGLEMVTASSPAPDVVVSP